MSCFIAITIYSLTQSVGTETSQLAANAAFVAVGTVIALRRPSNVIGPLMMAVGLLFQISLALLLTSEAAVADGDLARAGWLALIGEGPIGNSGIGIVIALVFLFPNGQTESPWNRRLLGLAIALSALAMTLSPFGAPSALDEEPGTLPHPFLDDATALDNLDLLAPLIIALGAMLLVAAGMLVTRLRRAGPVERRQIGWLASAVAAYGIILVPALVLNETGAITDAEFLFVDAVGFTLIPIALGVAIMRYRLYDIDVIVSKSVTYLGLAAAITFLYAAVVVVPLVVIGESDSDGGPGLLLPIVATASVAVLFEPIRSRLQAWANRLVYGERATPHEVLSQVTAHFAESGSHESTAGLARLLAEGTGAERAVVWLYAGGALHPEAVWPVDAAPPVSPVQARESIDDGSSAFHPVLHDEQEFGALTIVKPPNDPVTPNDRQLLADVSAGAGLLLRNISLNRQLEARAGDLRTSRQRLIAAHDAERHRLERDLHDGAQQQVVALKVKLGISRTVAEREGAREVADRISSLADDAQTAVDGLRTVAHGIYPPLLEAEGLEAALRAIERSTPTGVVITSSGLARYPRDVEATAYFFIVEAIERARMSGSTFFRADVRYRSEGLAITIEHDGRTTTGKLEIVADRVDALGGVTVIEEGQRGTTIISSHLPIALEPA